MEANEVPYTLPIARIKLGSFETNDLKMFYGEKKREFLLLFKVGSGENARNVEMDLNVRKHMDKIVQVYKPGRNFVEWKPLPSWGNYCSHLVPEGFSAKNNWQKAEFRIVFPDSLDDVYVRLFSKAFNRDSRHKTSVQNSPNSTKNKITANEIIESSDEDCVEVTTASQSKDQSSSSHRNEAQTSSKGSKSASISKPILKEIFDDASSNDSFTPKAASSTLLHEKSSKIKEQTPPGGYLDVSIQHLFNESSAYSPRQNNELDTNEIATSKAVDSPPAGPTFDDTLELFEYPPGSGNVIRIEDYKCLDKKEMLTGVIIDFYMQYFFRQVMPEELCDRVHICPTSFYNLYALPPNFAGWNDSEVKKLSPLEKRYIRVKDLNHGVNLFEKEFIVIPCLDNKHWFLAIACYIAEPAPIKANVPTGESEAKRRKTNSSFVHSTKQPCILVFNSSSNGCGQSTDAIFHIRNFIGSEYQAKHQGEFPFSKANIVGCDVKCLEQQNVVDCGLFMLEFLEQFFIKSPIQNLRLPLDFSKWFDPDVVARKRSDIKNILLKFIAEDNETAPALPDIDCDYIKIKSDDPIKLSNKHRSSRLRKDSTEVKDIDGPAQKDSQETVIVSSSNESESEPRPDIKALIDSLNGTFLSSEDNEKEVKANEQSHHQPPNESDNDRLALCLTQDSPDLFSDYEGPSQSSSASQKKAGNVITLDSDSD